MEDVSDEALYAMPANPEGDFAQAMEGLQESNNQIWTMVSTLFSLSFNSLTY